jgi:hypothetical protein
MKLIKTTKLVFVEGRTEKVYEVDLCEVGPNQFVVNFRYGKRGAPLKDGSKTVAPVRRDEADRVFDKLVQTKLEQGYSHEGAPRPPPREEPPRPAPAPDGGARPESAEGRKARILERLAQTGADRRWFQGASGKTWPLERAIWRAGELRLREAEPLVIKLIGTAQRSADAKAGGKGMRDYCCAWALGRLGGAASMEPLARLYGDANQPDPVRRIATEALIALSDAPTKNEFKSHMIERLAEPLRAPARGEDPEAFQRALEAHLATSPDAWAAVELLYVIDSPTVRPAVLAQLRAVKIAPPYFYWLRHVFKAAEYRRDAEVFGLLAYRFEKTRANQPYDFARDARQGINPFTRQPMTIVGRPQAEGALPRGTPKVYTSPTRVYLRRRAWRTLRRMGEIGDADYAKMAVGVLLPFTDADADDPRAVYDKWAPYWAFNHVLYENSPRYVAGPNAKSWRIKRPYRIGDPPPPVREEAFPKLWEARPEGLMHLLVESACLPVHEFAAKAIRACPKFLDQLDLDDVVMLLGKPYEPTARLGLDLAEKRHDPARPNAALLLALATCAYKPGREKAFKWIDEARVQLMGDTVLLAGLVLAPYAETREFARRLLRSTAIQVGQALLARLVAGMLALKDDAIARDATQTIVLTLGAHLTSVSADIMRDLLAHPLAGVQELGAEMLLKAERGAVNADVMLQILHSTHENVRAVGMRILSELQDDVVVGMQGLLLRLTCDANADVRNASRPILRRVAATRPAFRAELARGLVEALLRRKLPEEAPSHVLRVLKEDVWDGLERLAKEDIWRLLQSGSAHAQELGGLLLARLDPSELSIDQIAKLASHEILSVREASWAMYDKSRERVTKNLAEAARILDAKWQDSRKFGFEFFRKIPTEAWTLDALVTIVDSVREDVQAFGREMLQQHFREDDGPDLMRKLAEHPSRAVQLFTTNYLERYAAGRPGVLESLVPYFTAVLSRVNQGRIAKQRVLAFLEREGAKNAEAARVVVAILHRLSATIAVEYKGDAIAAMVGIHEKQPSVPVPLHFKPPQVRGGAARAAE